MSQARETQVSRPEQRPGGGWTSCWPFPALLSVQVMTCHCTAPSAGFVIGTSEVGCHMPSYQSAISCAPHRSVEISWFPSAKGGPSEEGVGSRSRASAPCWRHPGPSGPLAPHICITASLGFFLGKLRRRVSGHLQPPKPLVLRPQVMLISCFARGRWRPDPHLWGLCCGDHAPVGLCSP